MYLSEEGVMGAEQRPYLSDSTLWFMTKIKYLWNHLLKITSTNSSSTKQISPNWVSTSLPKNRKSNPTKPLLQLHLTIRGGPATSSPSNNLNSWGIYNIWLPVWQSEHSFEWGHLHLHILQHNRWAIAVAGRKEFVRMY